MLACQMPPSLNSFAFADVVGPEVCVYSLLTVIEEAEEASGLALALAGLTAPFFVQ